MLDSRVERIRNDYQELRKQYDRLKQEQASLVRFFRATVVFCLSLIRALLSRPPENTSGQVGVAWREHLIGRRVWLVKLLYDAATADTERHFLARRNERVAVFADAAVRDAEWLDGVRGRREEEQHIYATNE